MLAFEDLHWADPTSLDSRRALAERAGRQAAAADHRDGAAGVPPALEREVAPQQRFPCLRSIACRSRSDDEQSLRPIMRCCQGTSSKGSASALGASRSSSRRLRACCWSVASRAARKRSRRPCNNRSPRGSTGSAKRAKSRRSARCSAADLRMRCSNPRLASTRTRCNRRRSALPTPTSCSSRAMERKPTYRLQARADPGMTRFAEKAAVRRSMRRLQREIPSESGTARTRSDRRSFQRKLASTIRRSSGGAKRVIRQRCAARPSRYADRPPRARRSRWRTGRGRDGAECAVGGSAGSETND